MGRAFRLVSVLLVPLFVAACADRAKEEQVASAPPEATAPDKSKSKNGFDLKPGRAAAEQEPAAEPPAPTPPPAASAAAGGRTYKGEATPRPEAKKSDKSSGVPDAELSEGGDGERAPAPQASAPQASAPKQGKILSEGDIPPNMYFEHYGVNPTIDTDEEPRSTFAIDVDTASYTMTRSFLERGTLPTEAAVRVEEVVNSFDYGYEAPTDGRAFSIHAEAAPSPNRRGYHVLHVGIKGKAVQESERKAANLVFVVDVSGSMDQDNRLGLVKKSLRLLVEQLDEADKVGIVTYGSSASEVLAPTSAHNKEKILAVIDSLHTSGATNAEAGLRLGYQVASRTFRQGGINRVILCSDGVANVGITGPQGILELVSKEVRRGITVSTIGVGMGNYNDVLMEQLADKGNGNYYYVDKLASAQRVFVSQLSGTLQVIAKDAKIQVEFDKAAVSRYRLIGYENRQLQAEDFDDDSVDAGEIGAGHAVTAIYEVKLVPGSSASLGTVRVRYKEPERNDSQLVEQPIVRSIVRSDNASLSSPSQLSLVAAEFGEKLRGSYWARNISYGDLLERLDGIKSGLRERADVTELRQLIVRAKDLDKRGDKFEGSYGPVAHMDFDRVPVLR
jgi:Ca-activated chloride channel family protein